MERSGRRQFLTTVAAGGVVATAGCSIPLLGDGGSNDGQQGVRDWGQLRGTAGMTGQSSAGGPGPEATQQFTAEFRNGINVGNTAPLIGADGIYGVGKAAEPYDTEPPTFGAYAFKCSREDGREMWRREIAIREGQENLGFFTEPPRACLGPEGLYVYWLEDKGRGNGYLDHVERRSRADGSVQWSRSIETWDVNTRQPVVRGDTLFVLMDGALRAFATADGSDRWTSERFRYYQRAPSVGRNVVAVYNQGFGESDEDVTMQLTAFDRSDGSERWSVPTPDTRGAAMLPSVADGTIFVAEGFGISLLGGIRGEIPARRIRALDGSDGSEQWSYTYVDASEDPTMAGGTTSVAVDSDTVYAGLFYPTASQILGPDASSADRDRLEDSVYTGRNLLALDRADGSLKWDAQIGTAAQVWPYLVVDDTNLYAKFGLGDEAEGAQTRWYVIEKADGAIRGSFGADAEIDQARVFGVADGALFEHTGGGVRVWE